jgi:hypothetical protein
MVTRQYRLGEFNQTAPPSGGPFELLCEDHNGTYVLPYACQWREGEWRNLESDVPIQATVVGWRTR